MQQHRRPTSCSGEFLDGDAQIAAAVEAILRSQSNIGCEASEEELLEQALCKVQQEEDRRLWGVLREQQEQELAESILMDQMRERREREEGEAAAAAEEAAEQSRIEAERKLGEALEMKKARLPEEPARTDPSRVAIMLRLPSGQRLQRAFRASDRVGAIHDFVDLQHEGLAGQQFQFVSTMPRRAFADRQSTLQEAGMHNELVLLVELLESS